MTPLQDAYRWYRQQDPRDHGGRLASYPPKLALAMARADVAKGQTRYPRTGHAYGGQWQRLETMPRHASADSRGYYCDAWPDGWRDHGDAANIVRLNHTGWYEDSDGIGGTCQGRVLQLPGRDGKPVYVPGVYSTESDGVTLYPLDRYDDKEDCARAADGYAERFAESARDYDEAWQAGSRAADYAQEADGLRADIVQMTSDLRTARRAMKGYRGDLDVAFRRLCDAGRTRVSEMLASMATLRQKRDALRDQYTWIHNGFRENEMRDAFLEGYDR